MKGFLQTARPLQLLKTVAGVGWGQYCANGNHFVLRSDSLVAILGMLILWAGLYGLNDIADVGFDVRTVHKRFRPLAAGEVSPGDLLALSALQIVAALLLLSRLGATVALIGVGLAINQCAYSFEPFRLKRRFLVDVVSAAVFSHGARFAVGLQSGSWRPGIAFAGGALILWKVAAYLVYRLDDAPGGNMGRTGTAARLGERWTITAAAAAILASYLCFCVYASNTHLAGSASLAVSLLYAAALFLYLAFRRGTQLKALEMLVFSAADRSVPAVSEESSA